MGGIEVSNHNNFSRYTEQKAELLRLDFYLRTVIVRYQHGVGNCCRVNTVQRWMFCTDSLVYCVASNKDSDSSVGVVAACFFNVIIL